MKKNYLLITFIVISITADAQNIGIGIITPDPSAMLEIKASDKGLLIPRTSTISRTAIVNPAKGLMVYDSTTSSFWYHNGTAWVQFGGSGWSLTGNAGTDPATNFIGTTDMQSLLFKVNGVQSGVIDYNKANTGFGLQSLFSNTAGTYNSAIGTQALLNNSTGISNTAIGYEALELNNTGSGNAANGFQALVSNTTGNTNTANGFHSLFSNTIGYSNVAFGAEALYNNTDRSNLVAIGDSALYNNGTGVINSYDATHNTAVGSKSLFSNSTGSSNTCTGYEALRFNTTGNLNTANGSYALSANTIGYENTANGALALANNTIGSSNTGTGSQALYSNTIGSGNTGTGWRALNSNTTGDQNTAYGNKALYSNTIASFNTGIGNWVLYYNTTGSGNTGTGSQALFNNTIGASNTASGKDALLNNTNGNNNVAIGYEALFGNIGGYGNTALGAGAAKHPTGTTYCTFIGNATDVSAGFNTITNSSAIGALASVNASNKVRIGDANVTVVESAVGSWTTSDGRFKNNIKENVKGLEFIKLLRPVTYNFDTKMFSEFLMQNYPDSIKQKRLADMNKEATAKASGIIQSGFIAQEVEEAVKQSGYNFNGVHVPESPVDNWSLSYEKLVVPLVKAVQEQQQMIEDLKKENQEIKDQLKKLLETISKN
jgi:hypothetical protein